MANVRWPTSAGHASAANDRFGLRGGSVSELFGGPQAEHLEGQRWGRKARIDNLLNQRCLSATNCLEGTESIVGDGTTLVIGRRLAGQSALIPHRS